MKVTLEPEAVSDLDDLTDRQKKFVRDCLQELEDNPIGHDDSGLIRVRGRQVFKFVMKDSASEKLDFRAVYDIDGEQVIVYAVFHRDLGYDKEKLNNRI